MNAFFHSVLSWGSRLCPSTKGKERMKFFPSPSLKKREVSAMVFEFTCHNCPSSYLYPSSSFHQSFFNNSMRGIFRLSLQRRPKLTGGQLKVSRL